MKILTPTNLIAVEVPKDAKMELKHFSRAGFWLFDANSKELNCFKVNIPKDKNGNILFEILGEVTDTEIYFNVYPFIKKPNSNYNGESSWTEFWDYQKENFYNINVDINDEDYGAKESFRSLLQSNGIYFENPVAEPNHLDYKFEKYEGELHFISEFHLNKYSEDYDKWQSYKSKLIKGKLIILKQI